LRYFPVLLDVKDQPCVVVGAGPVAQRKVAALLRSQAKVILVSPVLCAGLRRFAQGGRIVARRQPYSPAHIRGARLVIAATNDPEVNARVSRDCRKAGIPVNVVDDPAQCSFIVPAVAEKGGLIIAISTSGQAPALSKKIRRDLMPLIRGQYLPLLRKVRAARLRLRSNGVGFCRRKKILTAMVCAGTKGKR
jgi:siroheme synthase-like protein